MSASRASQYPGVKVQMLRLRQVELLRSPFVSTISF